MFWPLINNPCVTLVPVHDTGERRCYPGVDYVPVGCAWLSVGAAGDLITEYKTLDGCQIFHPLG